MQEKPMSNGKRKLEDEADFDQEASSEALTKDPLVQLVSKRAIWNQRVIINIRSFQSDPIMGFSIKMMKFIYTYQTALRSSSYRRISPV